MIINKVSGICPVCEEVIEIELSHPDTKIEACRDDILLFFKCKQCGEFIDQEVWEKE